MKKLTLVMVATAVIFPLNAFAVLPDVTGNHLADGVISTFVYGLIGMFMAVVGVKVIDLVTPGDLAKQICEDRNQALATVVAALVLGLCIIIAAAIAS